MIKIRNSIFSGLFLGVVIGIYLTFNVEMDVAIVIGVFCAIVSPFMLYFRIFSKIDYSTQFHKIDKSGIIYSGMASHFKDGITVGGTLYLLKKELVFQTNSINFMKRHEQTIVLNQINEIDFVDTMGVISNGLLIKTNNNQKEQFVVNKKQVWKEHIAKSIAELKLESSN
jgi:hypothetical protein